MIDPKLRGKVGKILILKNPSPLQVEMEDGNGKKYYMDQAERFNAFNFNKFKGWNCNAGYSGIIIREPRW